MYAYVVFLFAYQVIVSKAEGHLNELHTNIINSVK